jgi:hypothetical protein
MSSASASRILISVFSMGVLVASGAAATRLTWQEFSDPKIGIALEYPSAWHVRTQSSGSWKQHCFSNVKEPAEISEESLANEAMFCVSIDPSKNPHRLPARQWLDDTIIRPRNYDNPPEHLTEVTVGTHPAVRFEKAGVPRTVYLYMSRDSDIVTISHEVHTKKFQNVYKHMLEKLRLVPFSVLGPPPNEVKSFVERVEQCLHWAGEVGDTPPERTAQIERATQDLACETLQADGQVIWKKYSSAPSAQQALRSADQDWTTGMGTSLFEDSE